MYRLVKRSHFILLLAKILNSFSPLINLKHKHHRTVVKSNKESIATRNIQKLGEELTESLNSCDIYRDIKICISPSTRNRLGLISTSKLKKDGIALSIPYDDSILFTASLSKSNLEYISDEYEGWTGDVGLIALMLLNEVARLNDTERSPKRNANTQSFISTWIKSLPTTEEMDHHPLFWNEQYQEVLQSSTTKKIYRILDDIEEDYTWLQLNLFSKHKHYFPEIVTIADESVPVHNKLRSIDCFNLAGFTWAVSMVYSRSFFLDGELKLIPVLDYANHKEECKELKSGYMGTFNTIKGVQLASQQQLHVGEEVYISYGPKSSIEYLLEYGFLPYSNEHVKISPLYRSYAMSQLTFEIDPDDRFYHDKLDILQMQANIDTRQTFDIYEDGNPDPFMLQFLRLIKLGDKDAFLLESIFRNEVWDFMAFPVSEKNEEAVVDYVIDVCNQYITELQSMESHDHALSQEEITCANVRALELRALRTTQEYMMRDREALDLKEYYQERRLKDLGLDSEWNPDDDMDLGLGAPKRVPGDGGLDW